ncbi:ribosomal proteins L2, C-terminal domain-containing protein [Blyttiomyces helicus]|uniref:Ribosomal proteins L2, C-terminal domain-containing protein n=1 Tax=Blyttiomyces helicus TaxID=388810 RepID=A0A4P9W6C7_9FUNG|nr:ribosomal proteins L2, C-terminal domain-containing protein [Blyttiomyces helicus]|eukprot:RKO86913.1 ribosomal proteins L2, C-terminal domain-containing protein [Blyttiomyces helicus]
MSRHFTTAPSSAFRRPLPSHPPLPFLPSRTTAPPSTFLGPPSTLLQGRHKTYVRTITKKDKKWMKKNDELRAQGLPVPSRSRAPVMENMFWKVVGNMKIYKPVTPGMKNRRHPTRFHLTRGPTIQRLSIGRRSTGGRDASGRISIRHRGGGHKKRLRDIDFHRLTPGPHEIIRLEYDPNRTADLALLRSLSTSEFSFIIAPAGVKKGTIVESWVGGIPEPAPGEEPLSKQQMIQVGNCLRLKDIPVGTQIHCIGMRAGGGGQLCRAAGASGTLVYTGPEGNAQVRLASKEVRILPVDAIATIGVVGNEAHKLTNLGKAGAKRWKGIRPTVRGIAMNAVDHPHGGGSKNQGGRPARTPWGKLARGGKTVRRRQPHIITPRWKAKAKK